MKFQQKVLLFLIISLIISPVYSQKKGFASINRQDLEMHMEFLASDELQGRASGEPGLDIAARYLAGQAKHLGLISAGSENGYYQYYILSKKKYDREKCQISIQAKGVDPVINKELFYLFPAPTKAETTFEGEVVFAGYGINDEENGYNDFEGIDIEGKVVLVMDRAPMNEEGTEMQFDNEKWSGMQNFQFKMRYIMGQQPKAILLVLDPKSGFNSLNDQFPQLGNYLESTSKLKGDGDDSGARTDGPGLFFIHRSVADQLLAPSGKDLAEIQMEIDKALEPQSFLLENVSINIDIHMEDMDIVIPNIFGFIEGSDPVLKEEMIIYMAHFDHLGTDNEEGVFNGADDNASGTVALIEIAEAFLKEKKHPQRSVGFLWVSAEEIGLFGSKYFAEHPLVPIENISAAINLDMVARTQTEEDLNSDREGITISGGDTIKVIGGIQSKVLMDLNIQALEEMNLPGNYEFNDISHPSQFFYRSDHVSFVRKDIPVIFYSTGTHADYHMLTDIESKLDYDKFIKVTQLSYKLGYKVANYKGSIVVDNPMSGWGK